MGFSLKREEDFGMQGIDWDAMAAPWLRAEPGLEALCALKRINPVMMKSNCLVPTLTNSK